MGAIFKKGQNFGVLPPPSKKKIGAEKRFWRDFGRLRTSIANVSGTEGDIDNRQTAANYDLSRVCLRLLMNFGPQTTKNRTVVLTHPPAIV